jgi:Helix-turn-helix of DDE superfamily endonuclease
MLRYRDLPAHTSEVLDLTGLTVDEFTALVPPFEEAFLGYMADWALHERRRQARRYTTYKNYPLPITEDRLLFILIYLKQNPTHLLHGHLFGMRQSKATQWIHVLLPVLRNTLRALGDAPCRRVEALCERLGVEVPHLVVEPSPAAEVRPATPPVAPLFVMMAPSDLAQWRVFLHPMQKKLASGDRSGAVRVLGGAGTGKTVLAMHRAKGLESQNVIVTSTAVGKGD